MKISFTGTRQGMTPEQRATVSQLVLRNAPTEVHHGDCVGADADFASLVAVSSSSPAEIVAHPGESARGGENKLRANSPFNTKVLSVKTHFARNRDLVDLLTDEDFLLVCPLQSERQSSGGTWYTFDYALKQRKKIRVVWPDGEMERWEG